MICFHVLTLENPTKPQPDMNKIHADSGTQPHKRDTAQPHKRAISPHKQDMKPHKRAIFPHKRDILCSQPIDHDNEFRLLTRNMF